MNKIIRLLMVVGVIVIVTMASHKVTVVKTYNSNMEQGFPNGKNRYNCDLHALEMPIRIVGVEEFFDDVSTRYSMFVHPAHQDLIISQSYSQGQAGFEADVHKEYLKVIRQLADLQQPDLVNFVDVGANIGIHSLFLASLYPLIPVKVHAFEPFPQNYHLLQCSALFNSFPTLEVNAWALGEVNKTVCMDAPEEGNRGHVWVQRSKKCSSPVPMKTLDDYWINKMNREKIHVLKVDVEGLEPLVLRGAKGLLKDSPPVYIFLEFVPYWMDVVHHLDSRAFLKGLVSLGYSVELLQGKLLLKKNQSHQVFDEFWDKLMDVVKNGTIVDLKLSRV